MCKSKNATNATNPTSIQSNSTHSRTRTRTRTRNSYPGTSHSDRPSTSTSDNPTTSTTTTSSTTSSSLSNLRTTLPENAIIYSFSEISSATNNFLAKRHNTSSSSSGSTTPSWRCTLRNKDVIIFQRKLKDSKPDKDNLKRNLSLISRTHHVNIAKLLGISVSSEHYIFIVYEFIHGANLANCLRNPRNPDFTVLSNWVDRMRVTTDLASAVDYIHNGTGFKDVTFVHDHIRSTSVVVTEPDFSIKLCHFGTALLCGDINGTDRNVEGVRGYMAPELTPTQKSDVYAFGVILLELVSGNEAIKYTFDKESGEFVRVSVVESAGRAVSGRDGELRRWVDRRLRDSFPVEVVEKVVRIALDCVCDDPDRRPEIGRVAGKMSRLYMESLKWTENVKLPSGISVSLAPR